MIEQSEEFWNKFYNKNKFEDIQKKLIIKCIKKMTL